MPSIAEHGLIGNMRSAALVSTGGEIDFFCFPEFDSPSVFASLLDEEKGGKFSIRPVASGVRVQQIYVPNTNVLLTRFFFGGGIAELCDFMPISLDDASAHCIIRQLTLITGQAQFEATCSPGFDYARAEHKAERCQSGVVFTLGAGGACAMALTSNIDLRVDGNAARANFNLKTGERAFFIFGEASEEKSGYTAEAVEQHLKATSEFWRHWAAQSLYEGRWREMVTRSALALKLMTSQRYGSLLAAPTFGLPELIGGSRNWDYRYTWLRDASFTVYALLRLGYVEEGERFTKWLKDRLIWDREEGPLQIMYGLDGRTDMPESELEHMAGYRGSKPVRIGNEAAGQLQLDVYGELFDALYLSSKYGDGIPYEAWERIKLVMRWLSEHWQDPDEGLWEVRSGRKHFLHSRLMCWVAFDRVIRLGKKRSLSGPYSWMEDCRDTIVRDIHENFWDSEQCTFVQYKGAKQVDASTLLMPLLRFISPTDPRWLSTLEAIEHDLAIDAMVKRYGSDEGGDGLEGDEGSFTACSFWLVEALARSRQVEKAQLLFEKLLGFANHLGLYSEELSSTGEQLGNFPQALTHLAFISAATYLDRRVGKDRQEPWS